MYDHEGHEVTLREREHGLPLWYPVSFVVIAGEQDLRTQQFSRRKEMKANMAKRDIWSPIICSSPAHAE